MMATKKLAVMVATMAAMTATTAVPAAFAQQEATTVQAPGAAIAGSEQYASQAVPQEGEEFAGVGVVESLGGDRYGLRLGALEGHELKGDFDFAALEGETVNVLGRFAYEDRGTVLMAESIEPTAGAGEEPRKVTWTFELSTECEPPAGGSAFFGRTIAPEGTMAGTMDVALGDPDGDGVYSGSDFGYVLTGSTEPNIDTAPPTLQVVRGAAVTGPAGNSFPDPNGPVEVIEDFGVVKLHEDKTFSASASFCDSASDGRYAPGGTVVDSAVGGHEYEDTSSPEREDAATDANEDGAADEADGNGGAVVSGDTSNANKDGSGSVDASGGAVRGGTSIVASVLPATGGIFPVAGAVGAMLIFGGLVARRILR